MEGSDEAEFISEVAVFVVVGRVSVVVVDIALLDYAFGHILPRSAPSHIIKI